MSGMIAAGGAALTGAFLSFMLSAMGYRGARLVSVSASLMLFIFAAGSIGDILDELEWVRDTEGISEIATTALKVIGIGYLGGICYDVCMDMGERGIASAVLTVGRVEILLIVAPIVSDMLKLALDML